MIFGEYAPKEYFGGVRHFDGLSPVTVMELLNYDFIEEKENQNYSPTTAEFLELIEGHEDKASFIGYTVSVDREDYRTTLEGIELKIPDYDTDFIQLCVRSLRGADEFTFEHDEDSWYIRAWWD